MKPTKETQISITQLFYYPNVKYYVKNKLKEVLIVTKLEKIFINWYGEDELYKFIKLDPEEYNFSAGQLHEIRELKLTDLAEQLRYKWFTEEVYEYVMDILDDISMKDLYLNYDWYVRVMTDYIIPDCLEGNKEYIDLI